MSARPVLDQLIDALRCLPGVGPKSAQRIAFHLLERNREGGERLARIMDLAMREIGRCECCRTLTEQTRCRLCADVQRDASRLCVVEQPSDLMAIEQATDFRGRYFVLGGHLSPLDGVGPADLGLDQFESRLVEGKVREIILAISPTVEGGATAHFIAALAAQHGVAVTRIAQGVPLGGELDHLDGGTLALAFAGRRAV